MTRRPATLLAASVLAVVGAGCSTGSGFGLSLGPVDGQEHAAPPADHTHTACEMVDSYNRGEVTSIDPGVLGRLRSDCADERGSWA